MADPTQRVDYAEVARLARDAFASGISARQYVAACFGWTPKHAAQMIYRARISGENVPKLPRRPRKRFEKGERFEFSDNHDMPEHSKLVCTSCLEQFEVEDYRNFTRHVVLEHKRSPLREERTPVKVPGEPS